MFLFPRSPCRVLPSTVPPRTTSSQKKSTIIRLLIPFLFPISPLARPKASPRRKGTVQAPQSRLPTQTPAGASSEGVIPSQLA